MKLPIIKQIKHRQGHPRPLLHDHQPHIKASAMITIVVGITPGTVITIAATMITIATGITLDAMVTIAVGITLGTMINIATGITLGTMISICDMIVPRDTSHIDKML
jgi:hypothetical protein